MTSAARQFRPDAPLAGTVDAFWINARDPMASGAAIADIYPDGCIDLIFHWRRCPSNGSIVAPRLFVAGATRGTRSVPIEPGTSYIGVRLRPGMSRLLIDADPVDLAGRDVAAGDLGPGLAPLADRLAEAADSPVAALSLLRRQALRISDANPSSCPPIRVRAALAQLARVDRAASIAAIAREVGVTPRSLHRDVVAWTGLAPKCLARILRFQAALARLHADPAAVLVQVAYDCGYADQAHMTGDFQEFAGHPPSCLRTHTRRQ